MLTNQLPKLWSSYRMRIHLTDLIILKVTDFSVSDKKNVFIIFINNYTTPILIHIHNI